MGCGLGYLSRIQEFYFRPTETRELVLWPTLVSSLGLGATASLLPALRSLSLDLGSLNTAGSWIHTTLPLISSTLQRISYVSSGAIHVFGVETFQNLLKSRSLELTHVAYHGYPSPDLLQRCLLFEGLESLSLEFNFEGQAIQRYTESPITFVDIFQTLENLRDLRVDLRVFPLRGSISLEHRPKALRSLHITGNSSDLQEFLLDGITSPSLHSLSVLVTGVEGLAWKTLCDRAVSAFPHIQNLSVEDVTNHDITQLLMPDLSSAISLSTLKSFRLTAVPHCLTDANVVSLAKAWQGLRTFAICDEYRVSFSANILVELSKLPHLRELTLPLNLSDLEQPLLMDIPTTNCPLRELTVTQYSSASQAWDEKWNLARNILMIFPMLDKFSAGVAEQLPYASELQKIMQGFHSVIAIQAHRRALRDGRRKWAMRTIVNREVGDKEGFIKVVIDE